MLDIINKLEPTDKVAQKITEEMLVLFYKRLSKIEDQESAITFQAVAILLMCEMACDFSVGTVTKSPQEYLNAWIEVAKNSIVRKH